MPFEEKIELVRRLESVVSLQKDCLNSGNWDDYDRIEDEIKKLENKIVQAE